MLDRCEPVSHPSSARPELHSGTRRSVGLATFCFFFQAEDGIRDSSVTGVQTCALPIFCFTVGGVLSGIDKVAQQSIASQSDPLANQQAPQMPENFLGGFLVFTLSAGGTVSYLILRSRWHGWTLVGAIFVSMYGISTVASQVETVAFLSDKLPQGMILAIFVQGAIAAALFAPLAVLALGQCPSLRAPMSPAAPRKLASILLRVAILVVPFFFLYMFFGSYVPWRNPERRRFSEGP